MARRLRKSRRRAKGGEEKPFVSKGSLAIGAIVVIALGILIITHRGQARAFLKIVEHAEPAWMALAVAFQLATYAAAGAVWQRVAHCARQKLPYRWLARLAVVKLTVDQVMPSGGMAGNVVVVRSLRRMGFEKSLAMEALLVDILAHYATLAIAALLAVAVLWLHSGVTPVVLTVIGAFAVVLVAVPGGILWMVQKRHWKPPEWLRKRHKVQELMEMVSGVSPGRIHDPWLLSQACLLQLTILVLDAGTLWAVLRALGVQEHVLNTFVAVVMATLAGTVSVLPGGLGTFEAGCIVTLTLLGLPSSAAFTGTLLLRGLTLWLPLGPGLFLARHEVKKRPAHKPSGHTPRREAPAT